jgi:hypothetical protein
MCRSRIEKARAAVAGNSPSRLRYPLELAGEEQKIESRSAVDARLPLSSPVWWSKTLFDAKYTGSDSTEERSTSPNTEFTRVFGRLLKAAFSCCSAEYEMNPDDWLEDRDSSPDIPKAVGLAASVCQ